MFRILALIIVLIVIGGCDGSHEIHKCPTLQGEASSLLERYKTSKWAMQQPQWECGASFYLDQDSGRPIRSTRSKDIYVVITPEPPHPWYVDYQSNTVPVSETPRIRRYKWSKSAHASLSDELIVLQGADGSTVYVEQAMRYPDGVNSFHAEYYRKGMEVSYVYSARTSLGQEREDADHLLVNEYVVKLIKSIEAGD